MSLIPLIPHSLLWGSPLNSKGVGTAPVPLELFCIIWQTNRLRSPAKRSASCVGCALTDIMILGGTLKKRVFLIAACLLCLVLVDLPVLAQSFQEGSEPDGFRGHKWGEELSASQGMQFFKDADIGGSFPDDLVSDGRLMADKIKTYTATGEEPKYGGANARLIRYGFCDGKLCEVTIQTKGSENWGALKEAVFQQYGKVPLVDTGFNPGSMVLDEPEYYMWMGKVSEMELIYNPATRAGELWIGSTVLREKMFEQARKKKQ
jgi:hypothetical protein